MNRKKHWRTVVSLSRQLDEWVKLKSIDKEILQKCLQLCNKEEFADSYTIKQSNDELRCVCQICYTELVLPKKVMANRVSLSISNVTRHIKNCWLKPDFKPSKKILLEIRKKLLFSFSQIMATQILFNHILVLQNLL